MICFDLRGHAGLERAANIDYVDVCPVNTGSSINL